MTPESNTCQICGRVILARTGLIAHHGYQRPDRGSGWQTASCMGARHLPYEQSCDLIPVAIAKFTAYQEDLKKLLSNLVSNPPETLIEEKKSFRDGHIERIEHNRPEDFSVEKTLQMGCFGGWQRYESQFYSRHYKIAKDIKFLQDDINYLDKRLKDWKAPALA